MEQLVSFSSRLLVTGRDDDEVKQEISASEKEWIVKYVTQLNEMDNEVLMFWIRKIKQS